MKTFLLTVLATAAFLSVVLPKVECVDLTYELDFTIYKHFNKTDLLKAGALAPHVASVQGEAVTVDVSPKSSAVGILHGLEFLVSNLPASQFQVYIVDTIVFGDNSNYPGSTLTLTGLLGTNVVTKLGVSGGTGEDFQFLSGYAEVIQKTSGPQIYTFEVNISIGV